MVVNPDYKGIALPGRRLAAARHLRLAGSSDRRTTAWPANPTPWLNLVAAPVSDPAASRSNMQFGDRQLADHLPEPGRANQKLVAMGRQTPGRRFVLGVVSLADAARYQLNVAQLLTQSTGAATTFTDATGVRSSHRRRSLRAAVRAAEAGQGPGHLADPVRRAAWRRRTRAAYPGTMLMTLDVPTAGLPSADATRLATFVPLGRRRRADPGRGQRPAAGRLPAA